MTRRLLVSGFFLGLLVLVPVRAAQAAPTDVIVEAMVAVRELRLEDAERGLASIPAPMRTRVDVRLVTAVLDFHRGRYVEAAGTLEEITPSLPPELRRYADGIRAPIEGAARRTRSMTTLTSADGRYSVRFGDEDRVLAPYLLQQLADADRVLGEVLGYHHPGPIRAEIYGDPQSLSDVSTLSIQAIETTGTIAICKFDRLMISSPRVLSHGYPWATTVSHEMVHLLVARATNDRAPTWFHEGIAKFLESSPYYGRPVLSLDSAEKRILRERILANRMLPFERFHPSVAMLPTPEDAALAYAEAASVASAIFDLRGKEGLVTVLTELRGGKDAMVAIGELVGQPFASWVETLWRAIRGEAAPARGADTELRVARFTNGGEEDAGRERSPAAARHLRLGDMLWSRSHPLAASREYAKARTLAPGDAVVISRLGRSALEGGDPRAAVDAAREALRLEPNHAPARALLAAALARAGDRAAAVLAAYDALRYNPFDPSPHCVLAESSDDEPTRTRESDVCRSLSTSP